jgi:hypothetical protein
LNLPRYHPTLHPPKKNRRGRREGKPSRPLRAGRSRTRLSPRGYHERLWLLPGDLLARFVWRSTRPWAARVGASDATFGLGLSRILQQDLPECCRFRDITIRDGASDATSARKCRGFRDTAPRTNPGNRRSNPGFGRSNPRFRRTNPGHGKRPGDQQVFADEEFFAPFRSPMRGAEARKAKTADRTRTRPAAALHSTLN